MSKATLTITTAVPAIAPGLPSTIRCIPDRAPDPYAALPVSIATRRDVFGTMGALLLLTATEAETAKAVELDGELLEYCATAAVLEAHAKALTKGIPSSGRSLEWEAADAMMEEAYDLRERAIALPARTPEGLQAKAKVVAARINDDDPIVMGMAFSIARDVLGRAGA